MDVIKKSDLVSLFKSAQKAPQDEAAVNVMEFMITQLNVLGFEAEPIVRCEDCAHWEQQDSLPYGACRIYAVPHSTYYNEFCSHGKLPVKKTPHTFAGRLRAAMREKGIKQGKLAETIGTRPQTVSLYLQGKTQPRVETLRKIAEALGVSADWLVCMPEEDTQGER
jgi:ribosome-binding protein aMBF1 (putative translation factor)